MEKLEGQLDKVYTFISANFEEAYNRALDKGMNWLYGWDEGTSYDDPESSYGCFTLPTALKRKQGLIQECSNALSLQGYSHFANSAFSIKCTNCTTKCTTDKKNGL